MLIYRHETLRLCEKSRNKLLTVWRWWKQGNLTGYQLPSRTIIITDDYNSKPDVIACIYARVSSAQNKDNSR
ncbi:hypothetical protein [Okeania sp. SIO2C2]|uniref:hypothetical protein n=1 Tax=Okeania sp. SIO2C2 TaxID=2607787 RepID=UPI00257DE523|nr:hypothetical protein [Okeania sp. SIO2C2]